LCRRQLLSVWFLTSVVAEKARGKFSPRALSQFANQYRLAPACRRSVFG
jgi:hypothetical protein